MNSVNAQQPRKGSLVVAWMLASALLLFSSGGEQPVSSNGIFLDSFAPASMPLLAFAGGPGPAPPGAFQLAGLLSPAVVTESIFVSSPGLPAGAAVTYFLDDRPCASTKQAPYSMGEAHGFSLDTQTPGQHRLRAEATLAGGATLRSDTIMLYLVPSINVRFSPGLSGYANHSSAQSKTLDEVLEQTSTRGAELSAGEVEVRKQALAMYLNWGIDPSLDNGNDQSEVLLSLAPLGWSTGTVHGATDPLSLRFSSDAPFYQTIPRDWPRVLLPPGYIQQVQLNTTEAGDGIGFGVSVAEAGDTERTIRSQWYGDAATLKTFAFRMPSQWHRALPWQPSGDHHMIFVDPEAGAFVSSYMTRRNPETGGPDALYAGPPTKLQTLGDHGGSIAAGFAELPAMLQPGEATNPTQPIRHALGGAIARTWAARVYPANARDANVRTSTNTCKGTGFTNTGVVPYGGVIQLDPHLDLAALGLTLPALRILQAIQTYGFYVEDFGCADLDIYTSVSEHEFDPYGGLWGYNRRGIGVQTEIRHVLENSRLYLVPPLTRKQ